MKKKLFKIAESLGQGERFVRLYMKNKRNFEELVENSKIKDSSSENGSFIISIEDSPLQAFLAGIIGINLKERGYKPIIIPQRYFKPIYSPPPQYQNETTRKIRSYKTDYILDEFGLKATNPQEYIEESKIDKEKILEIYPNLNQIPKSVCRKKFRRYSLDLENNHDHKNSYEAALNSVKDLGEITHSLVEKEDVDGIITCDSVYLNRVFGEISLENDIPSYSFGPGYFKQKSIIFGKFDCKAPLPQFTAVDKVQNELKKELSTGKEQRLHKFLESRFNGEAVLPEHVESSEDSISKSPDRTIGIFTNLMWDGSLEVEDTVFETPFEWLEETIEEVRDEDIRLILKTHPAEADRVTRETVKEWIEENIDDLPENFEILPPDTDVNPYEFMKVIDEGFVWNSTVGLEMAYQGMSVCVAGDTHYKDLGFTFDPDSKEEYFDFLMEGLPEVSEDMVEKAKRYCYLLFFRRHFDLPYFERGEGVKEFKKVDPEDIYREEELNEAIDKILDNETVIKDLYDQ